MIIDGMKSFLTLKALKYFCLNYGDQRVSLNLSASKISKLAISASFEYLCYESKAVMNILIISVRGPLACSAHQQLTTSMTTLYAF